MSESESIAKRTRIKMCGTTRAEDAHVAVAAGIDALGFIFVRKSPRYITPERACAIIACLPPFVSRVGVFVDRTFDEITSVVQRCGLNQLQLHGNESPEFCLEFKKWNRSISICKAFRVGEASPQIDLSKYNGVVDSFLFDTYTKGAEGGTGIGFNWNLLGDLEIERPLILAGGLSPENIEKAIRDVSPFAVDVNSGVEDTPGIKNHEMLRQLVARVKRADNP